MKWFGLIQKNRVFKFTASVRLAVPLMICLLTALAVGTVIESRYNSDFAKMLVYQSWWFTLLLVLLWVNILNAALSRIPFRKHHLGFVITHIGLLTLLAGGLITGSYGIDGQLRVVEHEQNDTIVLPNLVFSYALEGSLNRQDFAIPRGVRARDEDSMRSISKDFSHLFTIEKFVPFVMRSKKLVKSEEGSPTDQSRLSLGIILRSQFFNVSEMLDSKENPEMKMGPATLRIIVDREGTPTKAPPKHQVMKGSQKKKPEVLEISEAATGKILKTLDLADAQKGLTLNKVLIKIQHVFQQAQVSEGGIKEGGTAKANPALELSLTQGDKVIREVVYAKFPDFSLSKEGTFGLKFTYRTSVEALAEDSITSPNTAMESEVSPSGDRKGNVIEFHGDPKKPNEVRVELYKNGESVLTQWVPSGGHVETPWMGMKIFIGELNYGGRAVNDIVAVEPEEKQMSLPPSAILIRARSAASKDAQWLVEGDESVVQIGEQKYRLYFGRENLNLAFKLQLDKFTKRDYPGTETPMSYESLVRIADQSDMQAVEPLVISMNEPAKYHGYTLYQASYEMNLAGPAASIFSVNKDPGRATKYWGSLILCLGIIIFTLMRSRMGSKFFVLFLVFGMSFLKPAVSAAAPAAMNAEQAQNDFTHFAEHIDPHLINELPVQNNGRLKPFHSFARENILFLTGKYSKWGLDASQIYLALMTQDSANFIEFIEIRDPDLRLELGFVKLKKHYSLSDLEKSPLMKIAEPLVNAPSEEARRQTPRQKKIVECFQQVWVLKSIITGEHLFQAADFAVLNSNREPHQDGGTPSGHGAVSSTVKMNQALNGFMKTIAQSDIAGQPAAAVSLLHESATQTLPELFVPMREKMGLEVLYNKLNLFFWAGLFYLGLSFVFFTLGKNQKIGRNLGLGLYLIPFLIQIFGFAVRVYITGFAPVTNMYGTMIWVAFGVTLFSYALLVLYRNYVLVGMMCVGSGLLLLLTENMPLILSPDMDPIVAVLRSNYWLTIHVLTITISYAAFAAAMLIGNAALIRSVLFSMKDNEEFNKKYSHYAYRMIQLGVFLISAGIILGGIWADYSWGRFWGWDPKETWALIADLGFLSILHARFVGWLRPFGLLASAPIAFLLVIMAWYGVNFILATGLHSYGFSSGGATFVVSFLVVQLTVFGLALARVKWMTISPGRRGKRPSLE